MPDTQPDSDRTAPQSADRCPGPESPPAGVGDSSSPIPMAQEAAALLDFACRHTYASAMADKTPQARVLDLPREFGPRTGCLGARRKL